MRNRHHHHHRNDSSAEFSPDSEARAPLISFIHPLESFTPTDSDGIYPFSVKRHVWEFIIYIVAMLSLYEIPFEWTFNFEKSKYYVVPALVLDAFFFADLYIIENTGVLVDGIVMSDRKSIRKHIAHWRFIIYWLSPWPYYIIGWFSNNNLVYNICVTLKAFRILRIYDARNTIRSLLEYYSLFTNIFIIFFDMVLIIHISACAFWLTGYFENSPNSWISQTDIGSKNLWVQYFHTFYFISTTILTIGYGDFHPYTFPEMIVFVIIECIGIFFYQYVISNIVSYATSPTRSVFYLNFKNIFSVLQLRGLTDFSLSQVMTYFEFIWQKEKCRSDFYESASKLPKGLQKRIELALHMEVFHKVRSFQNLSEDDLQKIAILLRPRIFTPGDMLVHAGRVSKKMFFITSGKVSSYNKQGSLLGTFDGDSTLIIGETSIILGRAEQATTIADTYVEAFELLKEDYDDIQQIHPQGLNENNNMLVSSNTCHL